MGMHLYNILVQNFLFYDILQKMLVDVFFSVKKSIFVFVKMKTVKKTEKVKKCLQRFIIAVYL